MKTTLYVSIYRRLYNNNAVGSKSLLNKFHGEYNLYLISTKDIKIKGIQYSDEEMIVRESECIGLFENVIGSQKIIRAFPVDN